MHQTRNWKVTQIHLPTRRNLIEILAEDITILDHAVEATYYTHDGWTIHVYRSDAAGDHEEADANAPTHQR